MEKKFEVKVNIIMTKNYTVEAENETEARYKIRQKMDLLYSAYDFDIDNLAKLEDFEWGYDTVDVIKEVKNGK